MPRSAYYNSAKALVVSWLVFLVGTIGQIVLPLEFIKKLSLFHNLIPDSVVVSHLKLASLIYSSNLTVLDRVLIAVSNATAGFVGSIREIFIIIVVCNLTIFKGR